MKRILFTALVAVACATAALTTHARPLQRADVTGSPAWLVHIDWDTLRTTSIGQFIQGEMNKPEAQAKLAAFQAVVSIDLRTQLHGTTLYGTGSKPEDAVVLIYAEFDPERLVTLARAAKDSQNTTYKTHTIYNWIDEKKHKSANGTRPRVYAAIAGSRVVLGQREDRVAHALDVLDGASPNLASGTAFPQFGGAADTSFIEAAARKFDLPDSDPNAAILRLSKQVSLQVGQVQQQISATLTLEGNDEEVATHINSIAQGLISLMKLQKDKPEATKFTEALSIKQDGSRVVVSLNLGGNDAVELIKADAARKAAAKARREAEAEAK